MAIRARLGGKGKARRGPLEAPCMLIMRAQGNLWGAENFAERRTLAWLGASGHCTDGSSGNNCTTLVEKVHNPRAESLLLSLIPGPGGLAPGPRAHEKSALLSTCSGRF